MAGAKNFGRDALGFAHSGRGWRHAPMIQRRPSLATWLFQLTIPRGVFLPILAYCAMLITAIARCAAGRPT